MTRTALYVRVGTDRQKSCGLAAAATPVSLTWDSRGTRPRCKPVRASVRHSAEK